MAPESAGGVVDSALRVHGVEALRVADASIFPNITSANTNAPAILVGRKAGELVLAG
jgi:choline dehydrogenase